MHLSGALSGISNGVLNENKETCSRFTVVYFQNLVVCNWKVCMCEGKRR